MTDICAPGKYDKKNNTCFTLEQVRGLCEAYNKYVKKNKINATEIVIKDDKKYLLMELKKRFEKVCGGNEICLTNQDFMNELVAVMYNDIAENTFRPSGPEGAKEWLRTSQINDVLEQYEKVKQEFKFLGAVPLDCNKQSYCPLFHVKYDDYVKNGKTKLGIIFNYDKHGEPGSHWVGMYIDLNNGLIEYCDSVGLPPFDNVVQVIEQFKDYYRKKYGKDAVYKYNKNRYQMDKTECGIYSTNFIIRRLNGKSFEEITKPGLEFNEINACRNVYFSNQPSKNQAGDKCE